MVGRRDFVFENEKDFMFENEWLDVGILCSLGKPLEPNMRHIIFYENFSNILFEFVLILACNMFKSFLIYRVVEQDNMLKGVRKKNLHFVCLR